MILTIRTSTEQQGSKSMAVQPKSFEDIWTSMEQQGSKRYTVTFDTALHIWMFTEQQGSKSKDMIEITYNTSNNSYMDEKRL